MPGDYTLAMFRFYNPAPVLLDQNGLKPLAGGSVSFFEIGTTTKKDTWSDPDGGSGNLNPNPITIDADGRLHTDVFLDGDYTVLIEGLDGTTLTRDIPGPDAGQTIPSPTAGWFLTSSDGVNLGWASVRQVPDPTGQANKVLGTDGSNLIWVAMPGEPAEPDVTVASDSFRAGISTDSTKYLQQWGTSSSSASGGKTATKSVTFPTAFKAAPHVDITPTTASACSTANIIPSWAVTTVSETGFTVTFSTVTGGTSADNFSGSNILSPVTFMWKATGTVEVEE